MSNIAIRVDNLSKLYHLGALQQRHDTLRDALTGIFRRVRLSPRPPLSPSPSLSPSPPPSADDLWALKDVSFEVKAGEVVGIIGRNGAGKSTLLKILSRITEPTSGRAEIHGRVGSLLEVGTGFHPELSGRENIYLNGAILGMRRAEIDRSFDEIVAFAGIERFLDTPVKRYSSGMYVRLAFAVAAHLEPEILLVDEVLAVGDAAFQKKCMGKMDDIARQGRTVLFVSHNLSAVDTLCHRTILLSGGGIIFSGETKDAIRHYLHASAAPAEAHTDLSTRIVERYGPQQYATWKELMLVNAQGEPASVLQMGEKASFVLSLEIRKPCDDFEIGIGILNLQNVAIHYLVSGWEGFSSIKTLGLHTIKVDLPNIYLFPGEYQVLVWIALRGNYYDDAVHEALKFSVAEGRVNQYDTYFSRFSKNTQVYIPAHWQLVERC